MLGKAIGSHRQKKKTWCGDGRCRAASKSEAGKGAAEVAGVRLQATGFHLASGAAEGGAAAMLHGGRSVKDMTIESGGRGYGFSLRGVRGQVPTRESTCFDGPKEEGSPRQHAPCKPFFLLASFPSWLLRPTRARARGLSRKIRVKRLEPDSPAAVSALKIEDTIIEINGVDIQAESLLQVVKRIKSSPHTVRSTRPP